MSHLTSFTPFVIQPWWWERRIRNHFISFARWKSKEKSYVLIIWIKKSFPSSKLWDCNSSGNQIGKILLEREGEREGKPNILHPVINWYNCCYHCQTKHTLHRKTLLILTFINRIWNFLRWIRSYRGPNLRTRNKNSHPLLLSLEKSFMVTKLRPTIDVYTDI